MWEEKGGVFTQKKKLSGMVKGGMRIINLNLDNDPYDEYVMGASVSNKIIWINVYESS